MGIRKVKIITDQHYRDIDYDIHLSMRKTVSIKVSRTKGIIVTMPLVCPLEIAEQAIANKYEWIKRNIKRVNENTSPIVAREYVDGAIHYYLGVQYQLKIIIARGVGVAIESGQIVVTTPSIEKVEAILKRWYLERAKEEITPVFVDMSHEFGEQHKLYPSSLEFKHVTSYWGQCTHDGKIRLNADLVRAPREAIRFIIAHELCHLIHKNHSHRFYSLLDSEMPEWREWHKILNNTISSKR